MRSLILADIHANLEAFHAVLNDAHSRGPVDQIWSLGDIVGYGPNPTEVIDLLLDYDHVSVAGNHDWAAIGKIDTRDFNPYARAAAEWTQTNLSQEHADYLASLPLTLERGDFTLVHGTPRDPIWEYLVSETSASPASSTCRPVTVSSDTPTFHSSAASTPMPSPASSWNSPPAYPSNWTRARSSSTPEASASPETTTPLPTTPSTTATSTPSATTASPTTFLQPRKRCAGSTSPSPSSPA